MDKKCKKCGSENIIITVQYRKCVWLRLLKFAFLVAIFLVTLMNMAEVIQFDEIGKDLSLPDTTYTTINYINVVDNQQSGASYPAGVAKQNPTGFIIFWLVFVWIIIEIFQQWVESKTRIYYACKECGEIWYEQENIA